MKELLNFFPPQPDPVNTRKGLGILPTLPFVWIAGKATQFPSVNFFELPFDLSPSLFLYPGFSSLLTLPPLG